MANPAGAALLDDFNRATLNSTALWPSTAIATGTAATAAIATNALGPGGQTTTRSARYATSFAADQEYYVDVTATGADVFLYARLTGTGGTLHGYEVGIEAGQAVVYRVNSNASFTLLGTNVAQALTAGDGLGVSCEGTTIKLWYRSGAGGTWTAIRTQTDATYNQAGVMAIEFSGSTATRVDNLRGGAVSSLTAVGASLSQTYNVTTAVGASLSQSYTVKTAVGSSLAQSYTIALTLTAVSNSLSGAYTVKNAIGSSLSQSYGIIGRVGRSLNQVYGIGNLTAGSSLTQRYKVYRTIVRVGAGNNDASARGIIRTKAGRVYVFGQETGTAQNTTGVDLVAFKSDQTGQAITSFSAVTGAPTAAGGRASAPDCVFDPATGIVHMAFVDNNNTTTAGTCYYIQFDTANDTWGTKETVATNVVGSPTTGYPFARACSAIALDKAGTIHVTYAASTTTVAHKIRTGANTWSAATNVSTSETTPCHHQMAVDYNGDLHLAWYDQPANRRMRWALRPVSTGTWGSVETVADNTAQSAEGGLSDASNLDQCGSIVVNTSNVPHIVYLSNPGGGGADDNTGDFTRVRRRTGANTWVSDHPTRTSLGGVHAHTPSIYANGDDIYALHAHNDAPNLWPGYSVKLASSGSWTGGSTGVVTVPANSASISNTAIFDGSAYISGTRTSMGAIGSAASTLDGSASPRYDPQHEVNARVLDLLLWDENFNGAGTNNGMLYYSAVPTELMPAGSSLGQTYGITASAGSSLNQQYTVKAAVGRSLSQTYQLTGIVGSSLVQPYLIPAGAASLPLLLNAFGPSAPTAVGRSLAQSYNIRVVTGASLAQSYYIGLRPTTNPIVMVV